MTNILFIITRMDEIGGAQIHVRDLSRYLISKGHSVCLLHGGQLNDSFSDLESIGVEIKSVANMKRNISPISDFLSLFQIRKYIKNSHFDLISIHSTKAGVLGRLAILGLKIPVIFTAHGWSFTPGVPSFQRKLYFQIEKWMSRLTTKIIAVSHFDRSLAIGLGAVPSDKIVAIQNGMHDSCRRVASYSANPVRIVMVGRFSKQKDHATLLYALKDLREIDWTLSLVGGGEMREEVYSLATALNIVDRIAFEGEISYVEDILCASQLFVLTSNWEGLPRSIIEAMRAGLPVIATDVGGVSELVVDGETGYLVKPSSVIELKSKLRPLLLSPDLRMSMGNEGRIRYEHDFCFKQMILKLNYIYQNLTMSKI